MTPAPLRLAFIGQSTYFRACVPTLADEHVVTTFIEFRLGADVARMRHALDAFAADVVVAFRPEILPAGALADSGTATLGFLTEPIPRRPDGDAHPDLLERARQLRRLDPDNVDRLVSFDPLIVPIAEQVMPVWRSLALPVADRVFRSPPTLRAPVRPLFVGRATVHRERFLAPVKREFDLLHVAFGAGVEELERLMDEHNVAVNLHNEPYPSFENRVCLHLAAGHLVLSEPLSPSHGLVPGRDLVQVGSPEELVDTLRALRADPRPFEAIRAAGRAAAEAYRASAVFPALARDLLAEVSGRGVAAVRVSHA